MPDQWPYDQIETHADDAADRLTSQYADAEKLRGLLSLWGERVQRIEDAARSLLTDRWLDVAVGRQLDELGEVVGEPRLGRTDETYREAINVRITINQSGGEPERIIEFFRRIAGANQVLYQEVYPAKFELFVGGDVSLEQAGRVREIVPAGVGTIYISEAGGELPFGTSELSIYDWELDTGDVLEFAVNDHGFTAGLTYKDDPTDVGGFGELGIHAFGLDTGDVFEFVVNGETFEAGLTDKDDPILPTEGGVIAELFEV